MKKLTQTKWIYISLAGLFCFGVFLFLIVYSGKTNLSLSVYFFLVVILALVATGFLAGAMKSVAVYNVKYQNKTLLLAGPALIFFIILYVGFKYKPTTPQGSLALSVLVKVDGVTVADGLVKIRVGEYVGAKRISDEGVALFTGIDNEYQGKDGDISVALEGQKLKEKTGSFKLDNLERTTNITLDLPTQQESLYVTGRVILLPERSGIPQATVEFGGLNIMCKSDSTGRFTATLPISSGASTRVIVSQGSREIYNSLRTINEHEFLSLPTTRR